MPPWQLSSSVLLLLQADVLDAFSALAQLAEVAGDPDQAADGSHSPGRKSSDENISPANGHGPAAAGDASSSHARASSVEDSVLMKRRVQASTFCNAGPGLLSYTMPCMELAVLAAFAGPGMCCASASSLTQHAKGYRPVY